MARNQDISASVANAVNPLNKHAMHDGHKLNESYKLPAAHPSGRENLSYMHPHGSAANLEKPWQSVDKTLAEAGRHPSQLSNSKTVFPTDTGKVRGAPRQPGIKAQKPAPPKIF